MKRFLYVLALSLLMLSNVSAATYYINGSASSDGSGTASSPFNSWNSLPAMQRGDDVYFLCGSTLTPSWSIEVTWSGTSNNPAVIGSYYISGGRPVHGVRGARPIISGSNYTVPSNSCFGRSHSYSGLVRVRNKDYVHIQNLEIRRSGFMGLEIDGDVDAGTNSAYFHVDNVFINGAYSHGIIVEENSYSYGVIEKCEVTGASYGFNQGCETDWGVSLVVFQSPYSYVTVKNNYVHENFGEGIGSGKVPCTSATEHSGYVTIEDNIVWNNRRVDIYASRTEGNIIRRNVCLGAGPSANYGGAYGASRWWNQAGIWVNTEARGCPNSTHDNVIYSNLIAGHYSGFSLGTAFTSGTSVNNRFYNNTAIGNYINFRTDLMANFQNYTTNNLEFINNIFYNPPGATVGTMNTPRWFDSKFEAHHNAWSGSTIPAYVGDGTDILLNPSSFATGYDWQDIKESDIEGIVNRFRLLSSSNAINAGATLGSPYNVDFEGASRPSGAYDMGALEYRGSTLRYALTVNSGSGDGDYASGTNVNISADSPPSGMEFSHWSGDVADVANVNASSTTITMPSSNATVTANYESSNDSGGGSELLLNGDFELDNNGSWTLGGDANIVNSRSSANNGSYSLSIICDGTWNAVKQDIEPVAGHEYQIESYIRSANVIGDAPRVRVRCYDSSDNPVATEYLYGATGTTAYTYYSTTISVPATAVRMEIYPYVYQSTTSGTAWFDDLSVTDLDAQASLYTLTVVNGSGDGDYAENTETTITADAPPTGMEFSHWSGNTSIIDDVNASTTTLTMPASNTSVAANYSIILSTLTVNSGSGGGSYAAGTLVNIIADDPAAGMEFSHWSGTTSIIDDVNASSTFVIMSTVNASVSANYIASSGSSGDSGSGSSGSGALLQNGDFEDGDDGSWTTGNGCSIVNNSSEAHTGSYALLINADGAWNATSQNIDVAGADGHDYQITAYMRSNGVETNPPRIRITWYDSENNRLAYDYIYGSTGSTNYELKTITMTAPSTAVRLEISPYTYQYVTGNGTVWYDDITVTDLDATAPELVVNGDFELGDNDSWSLGNDCNIVSSSEARTGSYALSIVADGSWNAASQNIDISGRDDSHDYFVEASIKCIGVNGYNPRIMFRWYDASDGILGTQYLYGDVDAVGYIQTDATFNIPASAVRMAISPYVYQGVTGSGTVWYDDISVTDLDTSLP